MVNKDAFRIKKYNGLLKLMHYSWAIFQYRELRRKRKSRYTERLVYVRIKFETDCCLE